MKRLRVHLAFIYRAGSQGMLRNLLVLPLFALASVAAAAEPPEFEPAAERFVSAEACLGYLQHLLDDARSEDFDAVAGPYTIELADIRAHTVRAEGLGHRINEYRCAGAELSRRSWVERMDHRADGPYSIESLASAVWLQQITR